MNIPINKDFEHDYRETVYKGFTLHEAKYVLAGLVLIVSVCLFLWRYIGISPVLCIYQRAGWGTDHDRRILAV